MHAHAPKLCRPRIALELKDYTTATPNNTIKTAGEGRKSLRSTASCTFGNNRNLLRELVSFAVYDINISFE